MEESELPRVGLNHSIWNNNFKSVVLLALYPFILSFVVFAAVIAVSYFGSPAPSWHVAGVHALNVIIEYWPVILSVVVTWFIIAYFFQGMMIRSMSRSHSVTRKEEPELYNLVENMCIFKGLPMPRIEVIETHARNAFASGINESTYCITLTRGLMQSLSKDELEAVLAHELTHILNRDVRLMMVCIIFTGMLGVASQLIWSHMRYALWVPRDRRNAKGFFLLLIIGAILWTGYLATLLTRFAISRSREYMADAGAVQITKNPEAMMRALIRISGAADIPKIPADVKAMCFENARPFFGLLATHPPIESRIRAIADYSGLPIPDLKPKMRANDEEAFGRPILESRENWTTRQRLKGRRPKNPWQ